jgi:hypothetical protein
MGEIKSPRKFTKIEIFLKIFFLKGKKLKNVGHHFYTE